MKGIAIASLALLLFLFSNVVLARDVNIELRLTQKNPTVGDQIAVNVNLDQVSDLKGLDILISFDNTKLEYQSAQKGNLISDFVAEISPDPEDANETGKIEYMAVRQERGLGIDLSGGAVLTLNFVARSPGDAWIELEANDVPLADSIANSIPSFIDSSRQTIEVGQTFRLKKVFNYPNPVSTDETTIRVEALALLEDLEAKIYDISGELVLNITYEDFDDGNRPIYEYTWDCKNGAGDDVANGVYILWLKAILGSDEKHETWKIAILR
jgi:hypothetical protein